MIAVTLGTGELFETELGSLCKTEGQPVEALGEAKDWGRICLQTRLCEMRSVSLATTFHFFGFDFGSSAFKTIPLRQPGTKLRTLVS